MANSYELTITLDSATLSALKGKSLCIYKKVATSLATGYCPIWYSTSDLQDTINIAWETQYAGYSSNTNPKVGAEILPNQSQNLDFKNLLVIQTDGTVSVKSDSIADSIGIDNAGTVSWLCGIEQQVQNTLSPVCAFTLIAGYVALFAPEESLLLEFRPSPVKVGTIIQLTDGPSALVSVTPGQPSVSIAYDITQGWSEPSVNHAEFYPAMTNIARKMIFQSPKLEAEALSTNKNANQ